MKKITIALLLLWPTILFMGAFSETRQNTYRQLRGSVTVDDTALDGVTAGYTYQWADRSSDAVQIPNSYNSAEISFYGTDAADETCDFKVYAYRKGGPARLVYDGTVTLGTAVKASGVLYGDTITGTSHWVKDTVVSDSATNRIASLSFDLLGYKYVYVEVLPTSGTCASISAEISGF